MLNRKAKHLFKKKQGDLPGNLAIDDEDDILKSGLDNTGEEQEFHEDPDETKVNRPTHGPRKKSTRAKLTLELERELIKRLKKTAIDQDSTLTAWVRDRLQKALAT